MQPTKSVRRTRHWMTGLFVGVIGVAMLMPNLGAGRFAGSGSSGSGSNFDIEGTPNLLEARRKKRYRWGKRRNETNAEYDKRYNMLVKNIKLDDKDDRMGGPVPLYTHKGYPFITRTDIDPEFTADVVMYMEMLHREYGIAYQKLLGATPDVKEQLEVIVFESRDTYMKNGGSPGSGGYFQPSIGFPDRGPLWPVRHYRLSQFTSGIKEFNKWDKGTLKHEAAHMELQLRLELYANAATNQFSIMQTPRWFNEGHASVFEYWDFDLTVDENFDLAPHRGRYAPVIRRVFGTDKWKNFDYVWEIDAATWHGDMTREQGFLNYCQAWSLACYMMNSGVQGRREFRKIYDLARRVGYNQTITWQGKKFRAWEEEFPPEAEKALEEAWLAWVAKNLPKDGEPVPHEEYFMIRQGFDPASKDKFIALTAERSEEVAEWMEDYEEMLEKQVQK